MSTDTINQLVVEIGRSFLQYCSECWPWTSNEKSGARERIIQLAGRQQDHVAALIDSLRARGHEVKLGTYPTDYTDLHYVALDYLLDQLKENQSSLVNNVMSVGADLKGDNELADLIYRVGKGEEKILNALIDLQKKLAEAA